MDKHQINVILASSHKTMWDAKSLHQECQLCHSIICRFELVTVAVAMIGALQCTSISVSNSLFTLGLRTYIRGVVSPTDESSLPSTFTTLNLDPTSTGLPPSTFVDLPSSTSISFQPPTSTYLLPSTTRLSSSPLSSPNSNKIQPATLATLISGAVLLVTTATTLLITGVICIYCRYCSKKKSPSQLQDSFPSTPGTRAFTVTSPEPNKEQQKCQPLCSEMKVTKQLLIAGEVKVASYN